MIAHGMMQVLLVHQLSEFSLQAYSDVLGCKQDESGNVGIIDSWNGANPPNEIDPTQEGMCNYSSSFVDGKFSC